MIKTGLIGNGYWGKIIEQKLRMISDLGFIQTSENYDPRDFKNVDWIFIATPKETHFNIARACLIAGTNVFLEKPATDTAEEYLLLIELAKKQKVKLYVSNVFLYRKELSGIKLQIPSTFVWHKDGVLKGSIIDDLLYHDLYILLSIIGKEKVSEVNIYTNKANKLFFSLTLNVSKIIYFDYHMGQGAETKKAIYFGYKEVVFPKTEDDPLNRMITDCISGEIDFDANFELNLQTIKLMDEIKKHL